MDASPKFDDFVNAQDAVFDQVLRELTAGKKQTHWIWFIFPQMAGLGTSRMSQRFGITSRAEARGYLNHGVLGSRLRECTRLMLAASTHDIRSIMDYPDNLKFQSSMTLFATVAPDEPLFEEALQKFFGGDMDLITLKLLGAADGRADA